MPRTATEKPERDPPCRPSTARPLSTPWVTAITSVMTATSSGNSSGTRKMGVRGRRYMYCDQPPKRPGARATFRLLP